MNNEYTINVSDIYPNGYKVPEGKVAKEFRLIRKGDSVLISPIGDSIWEVDFPGFTNMVRIVLEDAPKPRRWVVEAYEPPTVNDEHGILYGSHVEGSLKYDIHSVRIVEEIKR